MALLVEDDHENAQAMISLLNAMGHGHIWVETGDQAVAAAKLRDFCYIILDLQIKRAHADDAPLVSAGLSTLDDLRGMYIEQTQGGVPKYRMQIIVLSGHIDHFEDGQNIVMAKGANWVIRKPILDNEIRIDSYIKQALRHAQRERHADCDAIKEAVRKETPYYESSCYRPDAAEYDRLVTTTTLLIDMEKQQVFYRGHRVLTDPVSNRKHLAHQKLAVLVMLAMHPGDYLRMTDLSSMLTDLGLSNRETLTAQRAIKNSILDAFVDALRNTDIPLEEIKGVRGTDKKGLVHVPHGLAKMSLQCPGSVRVVNLKVP